MAVAQSEAPRLGRLTSVQSPEAEARIGRLWGHLSRAGSAAGSTTEMQLVAVLVMLQQAGHTTKGLTWDVLTEATQAVNDPRRRSRANRGGSLVDLDMQLLHPSGMVERIRHVTRAEVRVTDGERVAREIVVESDDDLNEVRVIVDRECMWSEVLS